MENSEENMDVDNFWGLKGYMYFLGGKVFCKVIETTISFLKKVIYWVNRIRKVDIAKSIKYFSTKFCFIQKT